MVAIIFLVIATWAAWLLGLRGPWLTAARVTVSGFYFVVLVGFWFRKVLRLRSKKLTRFARHAQLFGESMER